MSINKLDMIARLDSQYHNNEDEDDDLSLSLTNTDPPTPEQLERRAAYEKERELYWTAEVAKEYDRYRERFNVTGPYRKSLNAQLKEMEAHPLCGCVTRSVMETLGGYHLLHPVRNDLDARPGEDHEEYEDRIEKLTPFLFPDYRTWCEVDDGKGEGDRMERYLKERDHGYTVFITAKAKEKAEAKPKARAKLAAKQYAPKTLVWPSKVKKENITTIPERADWIMTKGPQRRKMLLGKTVTVELADGTEHTGEVIWEWATPRNGADRSWKGWFLMTTIPGSPLLYDVSRKNVIRVQYAR